MYWFVATVHLMQRLRKHAQGVSQRDLVGRRQVGDEPDEAPADGDHEGVIDVSTGRGQPQPHDAPGDRIAATRDQRLALQWLEQTRERRRANTQLGRHLTGRPLAVGQGSEHPELLECEGVTPQSMVQETHQPREQLEERRRGLIGCRLHFGHRIEPTSRRHVVSIG